MNAYVIAESRILDSESGALARYVEIALPSISRYDGRVIASGGSPEVAEGHWEPDVTFAVVEFPAMDRAREWYHSGEYAGALEIARTEMNRCLVFSEGYPANI
ncbi:DUF1330 domain-containing protein [Streptomyces sp. GMY02]|nr:DUF1330 domain-containing protein [Streptomyces sp. GMY02]